MHQLTAVIITFNESDHIERCIRSLKGVADEIVVVDSFSTDTTPQICKALGVNFVQQQWMGYGAQKNFGQQLATHDTILSMDADEALDETLQKNILLQKQKGFTKSYSFNRLNNYFGKFIRHGWEYPDFKIRIFNRNHVKWNHAAVHEDLVGIDKKEVVLLKGDLLHFTFKNIDEHIDKMNRYTSLSAIEMHRKGKRGSFFKMLFSPIVYFINGYFLKLGFLDGVHGFTLAKLGAFATYLKYAKLRNMYENQYSIKQ